MKLYKYILYFLFLVFIIYYLWNDCKCNNTFRIGSTCHIGANPVLVNYDVECPCYSDKDSCDHPNHENRCKWRYTFKRWYRIISGNNEGNCIDNPKVVKDKEKEKVLQEYLCATQFK